MKIKVELKTKMVNDTNYRMMDLFEIKKAIDSYATGFNGVVVYHESLYDYHYDTKNEKYETVDSIGILGVITGSVIEDGKLYLFIDANRDISLDKNYICFFRAKMQSSPLTETSKFDDINIFAVDMILVSRENAVEDKNLSEVVLIED